MALIRQRGLLTMPPELYDWVEARAKKNNRSRNAELITIVEKAREIEESPSKK